MNNIDITGGTNPASNDRRSSRIEDMLHGIVKPNPPNKETFISKKLTTEKVLLDAMVERHVVVEEARRLTNRVSKDLLERIVDFFFNDGYSMAALEELATLKVNGPVLSRFTEILGEIAPGKMANVEHVEGVAAVARAILQHTMTHHATETPSTIERLTPFRAWRVRDTLAEVIGDVAPSVVEPRGFDNEKVVKEFIANFKRADIVLWNKDIWNGATRGYREFEGTPLTDEILDQVTPMFWQYELPIVNDDVLLAIKGPAYECVGFVIMPTIETFAEVKFPAELVKNVRKQGSHELITVNTSDPRVQQVLEETKQAFQDESSPLRIARRGISIAIIFTKPGVQTPEVRFIKPIFEGDDIFGGLSSILLAGLKFLNEKFVSKETVEVSKKELKQDRQLFKQVRKGKVQVPPIKIINLRRTAVRHVKDEGKGKREYSCHFFVDPHWRKQWYPTLNRHIPIYITTFVKGDLSKPLKPPREKVYKAIR